MKNAVSAGARLIAKEAKARVPVRTGALRKSIGVQTSRRRFGLVKIGPRWPQGAHGHLVEFGTAHSAPQPWLRPAFDAMKGAALAKIGESLGNAVERAAMKLAGTFATSGLSKRRRRR